MFIQLWLFGSLTQVQRFPKPATSSCFLLLLLLPSLSSSFLLYFFSSRNSFLFLNNHRYTLVAQRTFILKHESSPARVGGNALGPGRQNIPSAASFSPHKFHWKGIENNVNTMPDKAWEAGWVDNVTPHYPGRYSVSMFQRSSAKDFYLMGVEQNGNEENQDCLKYQLSRPMSYPWSWKINVKCWTCHWFRTKRIFPVIRMDLTGVPEWLSD